MNVKAEEFASTMQKLLTEYGDEVRNLTYEIVPEVGKEASKRLKQTSPSDTGAYRRGWAVQNAKDRLGISSTVHNAKRYRLTHLLENGHINKEGRRVQLKNGKWVHIVNPRTPAYPHIAKVEQWAVHELEAEIKEAIK